MTTARGRTGLPVLVTAFLLATFGRGPAFATGGQLDPSFGTGGKVLTTQFVIGSYATAVAIQTDGKIVAVGAAAGASESGEFAVARYDTNGSLDPTFSGDGMLTTPIAGGHGDEARSVAIQPNGKIVVAGTDSEQRFAVVRYLPDGTIDPSFGPGGIVRTNLTPDMDIGFDIAIQTNGRIVVAGVSGGPYSPYFAVVRYLRNGSLDPAFANDGRARLVRNGVGRALVIQPDGRIVVAGYTNRGFTVARLLPRGPRDPSFGKDGIVTGLNRSHADEVLPLAVALQSNGRIVVAGASDIFNSGVVRLTTRGALDPTFGRDGLARISLGPNEQAITSLAIQGNGRIVAAGHVEPHEFGDTTIPRIVIARFLRNGSLDPSWGGDGKVATRLPGGASCKGVALQSDGKAVVVGQAMDPQSFALVRYLP